MTQGISQKKCDCCDSKRVKGSVNEFPGWSYKSSQGYNYHVYCIMDMAFQSCWKKRIGFNEFGGDDYDYALIMEKLELPPIVKKKKNGKNGDKYWKIFKVFVTTVLSILFGDPTTLVTKLGVETVVYLLNN